MKTILCFSIKGGVGKSTIAVHLAAGYAMQGKRTVLVDLDPQGAAGFYLNMRPVAKVAMAKLLPKGADPAKVLMESDIEGLTLLAAGKGLRKLEIALWEKGAGFKAFLKALAGRFDIAILDSPPQIGVLGERTLSLADLVLVPVIPTPLSGRTMEMLYRFFRKKKFPEQRIRGVFNMVKPRLGLHREFMEKYRAQFPSMLQTWIPQAAAIEKAGADGRGIGNLRRTGLMPTRIRSIIAELSCTDPAG